MSDEYDILKDLDEFFVEADSKIDELKHRREKKKDQIEDLKDDLMEKANEKSSYEDIDYEALDELFRGLCSKTCFCSRSRNSVQKVRSGSEGAGGESL